MDRRLFLTTAAGAGAALTFDGAALAAAPIEASAERRSPQTVRIRVLGAPAQAAVFVAEAPYAAAKATRRLAAGDASQGLEVTAPSSPRPYFLVRARGADTWTAERLLPLQGGRNFRDLGGYRGAGGRQVRWGRIYRSGVMNGLTEADMSYLRGLGVSVICDLRSVGERRSEPSAFLKAPGAHVAAFDYEMNASLDGLARARTREEAIDAFAGAYVGFIETLTPHYTDMFARLARGDAPLALNCSAGKDRTGVGSALILSVLGVPRDAIIADYALTEVYTPPAAYMKAMSQAGNAPGMTSEQAQAMRRLPPEVLQIIMGSDPEVMRRALAQIDAKYGGPLALVKTRFGLGDADIARMRALHLV